MATPRDHLPRAPIVEALIDIRVLPRDGVSLDAFREVCRSVADRYPTASPIKAVEARFGVMHGRAMPMQQVEATVGWLAQTVDRSSLVQFRVDGFTYNKLEPYTRWDEVFEEAQRLWVKYAAAATPIEVSRLAVRYINRLRLPAGSELGDYLAAPPALVAPIPQAFREFLTRVVVYDSDRDASAIIVQALESALDASTLPILLDIDAFREAKLTPDDASMPRIFEQLRQLKNDVFFASITEKTVEMYI